MNGHAEKLAARANAKLRRRLNKIQQDQLGDRSTWLFRHIRAVLQRKITTFPIGVPVEQPVEQPAPAAPNMTAQAYMDALNCTLADRRFVVLEPGELGIGDTSLLQAVSKEELAERVYEVALNLPGYILVIRTWPTSSGVPVGSKMVWMGAAWFPPHIVAVRFPPERIQTFKCACPA